MHHHRPVLLDHQQPQRLGEHGGEAAGVDDLAAGDDQAHGGKLARGAIGSRGFGGTAANSGIHGGIATSRDTSHVRDLI